MEFNNARRVKKSRYGPDRSDVRSINNVWGCDDSSTVCSVADKDLQTGFNRFTRISFSYNCSKK